MEDGPSKYTTVRRSRTFFLKYPYATLAVLGAITLVLGWQLQFLSFRTSVFDLIIEDLPENIQYHRFQEAFGSDELIRIVVRTDNVFAPAAFKAISDLSDRCAAIQGVKRVIGLPEIRKDIEISGERSLEEFADLISPVRMFEKNLLSADRKSTILTLVLDPDSDKERIIADIDGQINRPHEFQSLYQIGIPLVSEAMARYVRRDFFRLPPVTLLLISVLLWIFFGNIRCLALPAACVGLVLIWTFGLMAFTGVALSMVTMIIPVFIIALGTAYCLHVLSEYMLQVQKTASAEAAVSATFKNVTLPVVLAVVTTIVGIGSLLINRITAIREFSVFACFSMLSLMIVMLTFFPVVLAWLSPPKGRSRSALLIERGFHRFLEGLIRINLEHRKIALTIIGGIALFCAFGILKIRVETTPVDFFKPNVPVHRHFHDIYTDMSGSFPVHVVLKGSGEDFFKQPENIAALERFQAYLDTLDGVDKTVSFGDYLKLVNYASNRFEAEFYRLPEEDFEVRILINNYESLLGRDMLRPFVDPVFTRANILLLTHLSSSQDFLTLRDKIERQAENFSDVFSVEVTGLGMVISASSHLITTGQIKSLSLSLVVVFLIMVLLFLSSKVGLIALLPNFFPILVSFGLMGWLGIKLSMATSLIAGIAIGLAVDDTIHYLVRYNREFKKDLNKDRALRDTVFGVGRPVILTTLIISVGFSVLMFSHFQPTAVFGGLMIATMLSALVGDLIILPSLLLQVELVTAWDLLKLIPTVSGVSSGFVHEMNQPLTTIKMGSEFLKRMAEKGSTPPQEQLAEVSEEISAQVDRAANLLHRYSLFTETKEAYLQEVDLNEAIKSTLALVENQLKLDNISIVTEFSPELPPVFAHRNLLLQAFYNLINNAAEAILAHARETESDRRRIEVRTAFRKQQVEVTIADTGIGIPDSYRSRIFAPFFTTKGAGRGKGLGLSITRQILRDYGGAIDLTSKPGEGATVVLTFPVD